MVGVWGGSASDTLLDDDWTLLQSPIGRPSHNDWTLLRLTIGRSPSRRLWSSSPAQEPAAIFPRSSGRLVREALADTPVVFVMDGIEVKAAASLRARDLVGLKKFRRVAGKRFRMGVLLYDGDHTTAFGDGLFAVPVGALWG